MVILVILNVDAGKNVCQTSGIVISNVLNITSFCWFSVVQSVTCVLSDVTFFFSLVSSVFINLSFRKDDDRSDPECNL